VESFNESSSSNISSKEDDKNQFQFAVSMEDLKRYHTPQNPMVDSQIDFP
jgi:hypothetical protein